MGKSNFVKYSKAIVPLTSNIFKAEDIQEDDVTKGNVAIVFPFGKSKKERLKYSRVQWPKLAKTPTEAEKLFASSYPKIGNQFSFKADNMKAFQEWVIEAYYQSEPPK